MLSSVSMGTIYTMEMKQLLNEWKKYLSEAEEQYRYHFKNKELKNNPSSVQSFSSIGFAPLSKEEILKGIDQGFIGKSTQIKRVQQDGKEQDWINAVELEEFADQINQLKNNTAKITPVTNPQEMEERIKNVLVNKFEIPKEHFDPTKDVKFNFVDNGKHLGLELKPQVFNFITQQPDKLKKFIIFINGFLGTDHYDGRDRGSYLWASDKTGGYFKLTMSKIIS